MEPSVLIQQFFNALALGGIYALVALGYTMVYGIIELINFAHGDVFMVGAFVSYLGPDRPARSARRHQGSDPAHRDPASRLPGHHGRAWAVVGVLIERFAYRPLRNAPRLAPLHHGHRRLASSCRTSSRRSSGPRRGRSPAHQPAGRFDLLGASISYLNVVIVLLAVRLMVVLQAFVGRTRLGRAMRSTAQDREAAQLMGVDINRTIALTFFIGSALAGAGGVVSGLYFGQVAVQPGLLAGLKAFTAAVLGGIGNTPGAALGGFLIGFIEVCAGQSASPAGRRRSSSPC